MQAKLVQLQALGERVSGLAGIHPAEVRVAPGRGGALVCGWPLSVEELRSALADLDQLTGQRVDVLTVAKSRLFDQKIRSMMIPTQHPVDTGHLGSAFGWRIDPFTGRSALHTGLDFQADTGAPIVAASGGVVVVQEWHVAYGNMVEIAEVGTTGRSTGPHPALRGAAAWHSAGPAEDPERRSPPSRGQARCRPHPPSGRRPAVNLQALPPRLLAWASGTPTCSIKG